MILFKKKKPICKTSKDMLPKVVQNIDDYKCFCDNCPDKNGCNIYSVLQSYGTGVHNWEPIEHILQGVLEKRVSINQTCKNRVKRDNKFIKKSIKNTPSEPFK